MHFFHHLCCSNIVHASVGLGLFAAKDFKEGDIIGSTLHCALHLLAINNTYPAVVQIHSLHSLAFLKEPLNTKLNHSSDVVVSMCMSLDP